MARRGWAGENRGLFEHPAIILLSPSYVKFRLRFMYKQSFSAASLDHRGACEVDGIGIEEQYWPADLPCAIPCRAPIEQGKRHAIDLPTFQTYELHRHL